MYSQLEVYTKYFNVFDLRDTDAKHVARAVVRQQRGTLRGDYITNKSHQQLHTSQGSAGSLDSPHKDIV